MMRFCYITVFTGAKDHRTTPPPTLVDLVVMKVIHHRMLHPTTRAPTEDTTAATLANVVVLVTYFIFNYPTQKLVDYHTNKI